MENKCPKCGKKLSLFYIKQECDNCGCNLLYYDMENRLEQDAQQAEEEYDKFYALVNKLLKPLITMQEKRANKKAARQKDEE